MASPARRFLVAAIAREADTEYGLSLSGLLPSTAPFAGASGVASHSFFDAVKRGRIRVVTGTEVERLSGRDGRPAVLLADRRALPADIVIAATGYDQSLDLFDHGTRERLCETDGELRLYRGILPLEVPHLSFAGWTPSLISPLSALVQACWIASDLAGVVELPAPGERRNASLAYQLSHARARRLARRQLPGSGLHEIDVLLTDLDFRLPGRVRMRQWIDRVDPADYAGLVPEVLARLATSPASSG